MKNTFFFLVRRNNYCCNRTGFHFMIKYTLSMANGRNDLWPPYRTELGFLVIYEALWIYQNIHLLVKNIAHAFTLKESTFLLLVLYVHSGKATKYLPDVNSFDSDVNLQLVITKLMCYVYYGTRCSNTWVYLLTKSSVILDA